MNPPARRSGGAGSRLVPIGPLLALVAITLCLLAPAPAVAQPPVAPSFFGVSGRHIDSRDVTDMEQAGVGTYRTLFHFRWAKRRDDGFYQWRTFDRMVGRMATQGIELLPLLYGTPNWIYDDEATPPIHDRGAATEWVQLLRQLASRYGPGGLYWRLNPLVPYRPIRAWQIWNEPNSPKFWAPTPNPAEYAALLQLSARAIRSIDPGATIVSAGIVADPRGKGAIAGSDYLAELVSIPGAVEAMDKVGYHPYAENAPGVLAEIAAARKALRASGLGGMPIWVTEFGWGANSLLESIFSKSPAGQAAALKRTYAGVLAKRDRLGVERLLWYYWRDQFDPLCIWCRSAGLLERWREPKPSFRTFQRLAAAAARPRP
mgnify:CR=1 FL=1